MFDFRLFADHSEREVRPAGPQVFTPPRDDFAGLSAYSGTTPAQDQQKQQRDTLIMRQALCLLIRVASCFACTLISVSLVYTFVNLVTPVRNAVHCVEQSIFHGRILAGHVDSDAVVVCNKGYSLGAPLVGIKCRLVSEHCVIEKHATVMKEAVQKCDREYAYVSKVIEDTVLRNHSETMHAIDIVEEDSIPHACMKDASMKSDSEAQKEKETKETSRLYDKTKPTLHAPRGATAMNASSIASVASLVLVPLAVLAITGVARGRADLRGRLGQSTPSAVDDIVLLQVDEDGVLH